MSGKSGGAKMALSAFAVMVVLQILVFMRGNAMNASPPLASVATDSGAEESTASESPLLPDAQTVSSIARNRDSYELGRKGLLGDDVRRMRTAIERDPKNVILRRELAIKLLDEGDLDGAVEAYRGALQINPNDSLAHADLARLLIRNPQRADEAAAQVAEAVRCIRELDRLREVARIRPGMTVADIGCGSGRYTVPLARWVGRGGRVFGVDIQTEALQLVEACAAREKLPQIRTVHCTMDDVRLPARSLDLAFMCEVYVHVAKVEDNAVSSDPWMKSILKAMKPNGKVLITGEPTVTERLADRQMHRLGWRRERTGAFKQEGNILMYARAR
ncbi:MAG: methyltransferase domain-containing protein [Armatimonadetes bacterium]|nr:methyltransferase domain-containing protein [Armatimonadota bacterium]